ncbi:MULTISPECIES: LLM class F420-dependent oxidoreductase [unclassified Nocardioides]|uniref:LLM class F420-dependent oxidoreductase n=1 Tax=unclassified Nocardioides TaxID=2615069 RepID=UPI0007026EB6|nr:MULTISPECIES: LLM class F420-dependent oxidoreductase [unclassified Nocardioides]KQZ75577.1 LLM class F420-dependent oxidoreductase [Nocardioides sp. Root151]KRF14645.1 LLM class F420-dependent oxidoreductase [Nocardioides sp. Soil796]
MKFAVIAPTAAGTTADPVWMTAYAQHVEACGFESLVLVEHAVVMSRYSSVYPYDASGKMELADDLDIPDPLDLLAFLAGQTTTLGLATGVLVLPNHHPVVLAKRLATIDRLSGGRLRVCVGMGWMKEEIEACGAPFESRGRRADEQLQVLRELWADSSPDGADHHGEFFDFDGAMSYPKPAQPGGVPLHVGGHSKAAARRAGRYGDGLQPLGVAGEELAALVKLMRTEAEGAGRDPEALEVSLGHLVSRIDQPRAERLAAQGADRIVLAAGETADLDQARDELSACAQRLGLS